MRTLKELSRNIHKMISSVDYTTNISSDLLSISSTGNGAGSSVSIKYNNIPFISLYKFNLFKQTNNNHIHSNDTHSIRSGLFYQTANITIYLKCVDEPVYECMIDLTVSEEDLESKMFQLSTMNISNSVLNLIYINWYLYNNKIENFNCIYIVLPVGDEYLYRDAINSYVKTMDNI